MLPDDPLLLEAETWVDQRVTRFYPDVWRPEGISTPLPNHLMILRLARSWAARGDASVDLSAALADYRRAIRLGRLMRAEDAVPSTDLIGLRCMQIGLEAMVKRLRDVGGDPRTDQVSLALCDLDSQRLSSRSLMSVITVRPFLRISWLRIYLDVPDDRLTELGGIALGHPNRRFRSEATQQLCQVRWRGRGEQRRRARELMDRVAADGDPHLVADAACLEDPIGAGQVQTILSAN